MDEIWTMRDGTEILIKDMNDEHLLNAMSMLESRHRSLFFGRFTIEDTFPIYTSLMIEAVKRRLKNIAKKKPTAWNKPLDKCI